MDLYFRLQCYEYFIFHKIFNMVIFVQQLLGANFTNILRAAFSYESFVCCFLYLGFRFELLWRKNIGANALIKCWWNWPQGIFQVQDLRLMQEYGITKKLVLKITKLTSAEIRKSGAIIPSKKRPKGKATFFPPCVNCEGYLLVNTLN